MALFYIRFLSIYLFSSVLDLFSSNGIIALAFFVLAIAIVFCLALYETDSIDLVSFVSARSIDLKQTILQPFQSIYRSVLVCVQYVFDVALLFGLSRQITLYSMSQSAAISFLAMSQIWFFITFCYVAIFIANWRWNNISSILQLHLSIKNWSANTSITSPDALVNNIFLKVILAVASSTIILVACQFYLSGSISLLQPYALSLFVYAVCLLCSISCALWGHQRQFWSEINCLFMTVSAFMAILYFSKVFCMVFFNIMASDFYNMSTLPVIIGLAVPLSVLYGQAIKYSNNLESDVKIIYNQAISSTEQNTILVTNITTDVINKDNIHTRESADNGYG